MVAWQRCSRSSPVPLDEKRLSLVLFENAGMALSADARKLLQAMK
jgi:hypothetical protein